MVPWLKIERESEREETKTVGKIRERRSWPNENRCRHKTHIYT